MKKIEKYTFKNKPKSNATNDFYWDSKFETYFNLGETGAKTQRDILFNKLQELKKEPSLNLTKTMTKTHFQGTNNQVTYNLKSFQVYFRNLNTNLKFSMKNVELQVPFSYIPIIYSLDSDSLICFVILTTKFDDKFTKCILKEDKVYHFVNSYESLRNVTKESFIPYSHFQSIKFDWITPNFVFEVTVKMPSLEICYESNNIKINKILDIDLMIDLLKNDFINWDNKVINYMNRIKMFRQIINKSFSKFSLKNQSSNNMNQGATEKMLEFDLIKEQYFNEKNIIFNFGLTGQDNINKLITFKTYQILTKHYSKNLNIDLNFKQFKILEKISETLNVETFIKKLIVIDDKEPFIKLNIQYFDYIDDNFFKFMKKSKLTEEISKTAHSDISITIKYLS